MDHAAINHIDNGRVYGIIYNSSKPVGGIRYYKQDRKVPVTVHKHLGQINGASVTIQKPQSTPVREQGTGIHTHRVQDVEPQDIEVGYQREDELKYQKITGKEAAQIQEIKNLNDVESLEEKLFSNKHDDEQEYFANRPYQIFINHRPVNLSAEGIARPRLNAMDKKWLKKARYYFINAKEKGVKIGSAEEYTTPEILEALWATADHVGIDPKRFIIQVYNESRFNPNAKGKAGERGIGQFMKATARGQGYDWSKMKRGEETFAYQAKSSAEFIKKVGEKAYNGKGWKAMMYQRRISSRLKKIDNVKV